MALTRPLRVPSDLADYLPNGGLGMSVSRFVGPVVAATLVVCACGGTNRPPLPPPPEAGLEGVRTDYPEYYDNIIREINGCFRWRDGGSWRTTVSFVIGRDGTSSDIELVTRSGNSSFDTEAMRAVECAGEGAFGPLPQDPSRESLRVQFNFEAHGQGTH